jgi:Glycosyl hydrolase family 26
VSVASSPSCSVRVSRRPAGATVALLVALLVVCARPDSAAASWSSRLAKNLRATDSALFGASTPGFPWDSNALSHFVDSAGKRPRLVMTFHGWAYEGFPTLAVNSAADIGAIPVLTWNPWDYKKGIDQPAYSLRRIIRGRFDRYIRRFARSARAWGRPLFLRFAAEMNGDWLPWSEGVNGNRQGQYVKAWRHVHRIFTRVDASNVAWVWSPNAIYTGSTPLPRLYPGDAYVDWLGVDGYNWGTVRPSTTWRSFRQVFRPTLTSLRRLSRRPIMLSEVASTEVGGDKARWITNFFRGLERNRDVLAFVWFNHRKETNWRIESSAASKHAFANGVSDRRYRSAR